MRSDRGSVLLLFPAAFVVVLVLGALAIDSAAVFLHQRELASAAGAAANDAATLAVDRDRLRDEGEVWLDPARVDEIISTSLSHRGVLDELLEAPTIVVTDGTRVQITLVAHASYVLAPALPGGLDGRTVQVTVSVDAVLDD